MNFDYPTEVKDPETGLEPKQLRFCEEYLLDMNATQAAIRAGYTPAGAAKQGCRMLARPQTQQYLRKKQAETLDELGLIRTLLLNELQQIAAGTNVSDFIDETGNLKNICDLPDEMKAALQIQSKEVLVNGEVKTLNTRKLLNRMDMLSKICRNLSFLNGKSLAVRKKRIRIVADIGDGKEMEI